MLMALVSLSQAGKRANLGGMEGVVERMGVGIEELGRGNTGASFSTHGTSAYWNPALLALSAGVNAVAGAEQRSLDRLGYALGAQGAVGRRAGVGAVMAVRMDRDFAVIDEEDDFLGTAKPSLGMGWVGVGWRLTRRDEIGVSMAFSWVDLGVAKFYSDIDMVDAQQGNSSLTIGYHRSWGGKWNLGVVLRNVGFNSKLSARWEQVTSRDNSLPSSRTFRPKVLQIALRYSETLYNQPLALYLEVLDYQLADTLWVWDNDWHEQQARMGIEWQALERGVLRAGFHHGHWAWGASYEFRIRTDGRQWPLIVDWALLWEANAQQWNPLSVGVRTNF